MSEFFENFHFLRPWLLLLLALPIVLYWHFYKHLDTVSSWEKVCDKNLLDFLLVKGSSIQRRFVFYLCGLSFLVTVIAAAGPSWKKKEAESLTIEKPLMIVLNLSTEMDEKDIKPSRLSRAKYAISDLVKEVKQVQMGLIVYAGEPFLISPITEDGKIITNLLPSIDFDIMPENGDRLSLALRLAAESLEHGGWQHGQIIVFTSSVRQNFADALKQAKIIAEKGMKLNIVNVNSQNNEQLERVAKSGDGNYYSINEIAKLIRKIQAQKAEDMKQSQNKISQWIDEGWFLTFIPLICCAYLFRRGILILILFLALSKQAYAGFFLNADQEGMRAFAKEDYQKAATVFKNTSWQASSYYRLGDYDKAYKKFSVTNDIESLYNQGNALAKMGKIEEAIQKYEEVLEKNPEHEDAKFNLEYLKQQQQNQSQSSSNDDEKNDDEQNQSQQQGASAEQSNEQQNDEETQDNNSEGEDQQNNSKSHNQEQGRDEQKDQKKEERTQEQQSDATEPKKEQNKSQQKNSGGTLQNNDGDDSYTEEVQARELQYREIPEDPGGLLRAFIVREYEKNRYKQDK